MDVTTVDVMPEECIATIISFTSPREACRDSLVSRIFASAAGSDLVWERFLPPDYQQIISESVSSGSSASSSLNNLSKKDLYFHLCDNPILLGNGNRSFAIDKLSGKKCYMLGARELSIVWGDNPQYWRWISSAELPVLAQSRFSEVALLLDVCWLEIRDTPGGHDGRLPRKREDKWFEIEFGEFFSGQVGSLVEMHLLGTAGNWKSGLVVHGIELRPK
ncbi:F-box protein PP2-B1-like isoform X2 [Alnus glutinosa]|uniref:F-box protein PP2-B1-like isoform X2 n=1 Tax=Alnus glutinosa TaxID=3517 RepID=UPI002D78113A|nr:F-box protein PP2-B1-like isoform X2 [Alnus glutinosa]